MFPALHFSALLQTLSLPFLSFFTGEEVPIHLSKFFTSRKAQRGSELCVQLHQPWSPSCCAPAAQELLVKPGTAILTGSASLYNQNPPSIMLQSREAKYRVYL